MSLQNYTRNRREEHILIYCKKNIEVVCAIILMEQGYLIGRRGTKERENIWEFPGGKVEQNESKEQAVVREIKEELEIDVKVQSFLIDIMDEREDSILHVSAYRCIYIKGDIILHAHHEVRYVTPQELFHYSFEEADQAILNAIQRETR